MKFSTISNDFLIVVYSSDVIIERQSVLYVVSQNRKNEKLLLSHHVSIEWKVCDIWGLMNM